MDIFLWNLLDLALAGVVLGLGWAAISSPDLKRGVILFIAFGLVIAIIWARLRAPDLALAEAAIGAGLSGALLLSALGDESETEVRQSVPAGLMAWLSGLLAFALAGLMGWVLITTLTTADPVRLADEVAANLNESGVTNPVTADLLNFRAYDTLLELAVLLAAILGIFALGSERSGYAAGGPVLSSLIHWLLPLLVLTAGYLLWAGAHAPGGAFQAGALLAAAAVLLRLGGGAGAGMPGPDSQRVLLAVGVGVFLTVGLAVTALGSSFLTYPRAWSGALILLIETAATFAIAVTLASAFVGGRPAGWDSALSRTMNQRTESS